jgi:hypothetical protein
VVDVAQASVVNGFAVGVLRETVTTNAFKITKYPITRNDFKKCERAGACSESKQEGCLKHVDAVLYERAVDDGASPETCVSVAEATSYCKWIGGRLPTVPEWLLAARGPTPHVYAWGDTPATCDQHIRARDLPFKIQAPVGDGGSEAAGCGGTKLIVGQHEAGASPSGMEDVLLTAGELLAPQKKSLFGACSEGVAGCYVFGAKPGAIEAVFPVMNADIPALERDRAPHQYSFRCVLEEG